MAIAAAAIALSIGFGYALLLPWIVRRQVTAVFRGAGLTNVSFDLRGSTLWATDIANISAGDEKLLQVGSVAVRYSPLRALRGELDTIVITDARVRIDLDRPPALGGQSNSSTSDATSRLPFEKVELRSSSLVLNRGGRSLELPLDGSLGRAGDDGAATAQISLNTSVGGTPVTIRGTVDPRGASADLAAEGANVEIAPALALLPADVIKDLRQVTGRVDFSAHFKRTEADSQLHADLHLTLKDISLATRPTQGLAVEGLSGSITFDDLLAPSTSPNQQLSIARISVGEQTVSDVVIAAQLANRHDLHVQVVRGDFAGGRVTVRPFDFDPSRPVLATTLVAEHIGLDETVKLATGGRGGGTGTASGTLPVNIDLSGDAAGHVVTIGEGSFRADAGGNLRLGEATADFGEVMERANPEFASDPEMRELKEGVLEAVKDFDYHLLEVRFSRTEGEGVITLKLFGRGRTGQRVPVNFTMSLRGAEEVINSYLFGRSGVFHSGTTQKALP
jgi:hypothetical protein